MDNFDIVKNQLLDVLVVFENYGYQMLHGVAQFLYPNSKDENLLKIRGVIEKSNGQQVMVMKELVRENNEQSTDEKNLRRESIETIVKQEGLEMNEFEELLLLALKFVDLRSLMTSFNAVHLIRLYESIPIAPEVQQLQLLQQITLLFQQIESDSLQNLHLRLQQPDVNIANVLQLAQEHFQLYQPLKQVLQLPIDQVLKLREAFLNIKERETLIILLKVITGLNPMDVQQLVKIFNPQQAFENNNIISQQQQQQQQQQKQQVQSPPQGAMPSISNQSSKKFSLEIVEQPPEKSVYKRNLKPNPVVMVVCENEKEKLDSNFYVVPILIRCDTFTEEPKFLTGDKPLKVTNGKVVTFKRLKITTTSHLQQETLFCLKFELRQYQDEENFLIIDSIHSNPICVLSHSTQLKQPTVTGAKINEVIPANGPTTGGTRVAILGNNFVDNPSVRIKFDDNEVMPHFHGSGTLLCHTPQHTPGTVSVKVCNSTKQYGDSQAIFTYSQPTNSNGEFTIRQNSDFPNDQSFTFENFPTDLNTSVFQNNFDSVRRFTENGSNLNFIDNRSFTALHYASANGFHQILSYLIENGANVNYQDKYGLTALHYAIKNQNKECIQILIEQGSANINLFDFNGISPIILAIFNFDQNLVDYLIEHGSNLNSNSIINGVLCSPLHVATAICDPNISNQLEIFISLIKNGAFLNSIDDFGDTPLHWAVRESKSIFINLLIQSNSIFLDAKNDDFETPFLLAQSSQKSKDIKSNDFVIQNSNIQSQVQQQQQSKHGFDFINILNEKSNIKQFEDHSNSSNFNNNDFLFFVNNIKV